MRYAKALEVMKPLWNAYSKSGLAQDAAETLGAAGVLAGGQALFTDMTPEQILLSTLLGGGAAFAARPIAAKLGGAVGKRLDKNSAKLGEKIMTVQPTVPPLPLISNKKLNWTDSRKLPSLRQVKAGMEEGEFNNLMNYLAAHYPGTPQSIKNAASAATRGESYYSVLGEKMPANIFGSLFGRNMDKDFWKGYQALAKAKYVQNFKGKTPIEGLLTSLGRVHGDNIAQGTIAFATPALLANNAEEVVVA